MKRTARVARTAYDLKHLNHIRVPEFALLNLNLGIGGKSSKCYRPDDAPPPASPDTGSDTFHFAPEKETIEIRYEIYDPFAFVASAKLELFQRLEPKALWSFDMTKLGSDWWAHGKHVIKWDGRIIDPSAEQKGTPKNSGLEHDLTAIPPDLKYHQGTFPDGYVTLDHTPYKMKMTLIGGEADVHGKPDICWTYYHILLKSIVIELGPEDAVPAVTVNDAEHKRNKAVRKQIETDGGSPAAGATPAATRKVILLSNVFQTGLAQMGDNSGFTAYQGLWGDGPKIPLIAKIRLADSSDNEVKLESDKGAVALGRVKFLWDWEDPAENVAGQQSSPKPQTFINDAIKYYNNGTDPTRAATDHTYPKGDNCHVDRGGKRGPSAKPVFPEGGANFPFTVTPLNGDGHKRKWASLSSAKSTGKYKGQTGVVFQPSRMAGDDYIISVYLAYEMRTHSDLALDVIDEPLTAPAAIQAKTGTFQVWREVHLSRYLRKTAALTAFFPGGVAGVQTNYTRAYISMVDKMDASNNYVFSDHRFSDGTTPNYNTLLRAQLTDIVFAGNLATDSAADHSSVDSMVLTRTYVAFVTAVHISLNPMVPAAPGDFAAAGLTPDQLGAANTGAWPANAVNSRLIATQAWLTSQNYKTNVDYCHTLDNLFFFLGDAFATSIKVVAGRKNGVGAPTPDGIVTLHFNYTHTYMRDQIAAGVGMPYWYGKAINPGDADSSRSVIMFWMAGVPEFTHESGHCLFLPHARYGQSGPPGGNKAERHDDTDQGCFMSYSVTRPAFCGLCQLRLRGWDNVLADGAGKTWNGANRLNKISANNTKP